MQSMKMEPLSLIAQNYFPGIPATHPIFAGRAPLHLVLCFAVEAVGGRGLLDNSYHNTHLSTYVSNACRA